MNTKEAASGEVNRMQYVIHILSFSNYAVNIFFYFIWSQRYREEFISIFGRKKGKKLNLRGDNVELKEINKQLLK